MPAARAAAREITAHPLSRAVEAETISPATAPASVSSRQRAVILLGSGVLGLIAAVFAAVGAQAMRPRPSSATSVSERFGLDVIGEIPQRRKLQGTAAERVNGSGAQELLEAFQKLAVNLEILVRTNSMIAVTSWHEGEGKTLTTCQLAWALASLGEPVTVVDFDLRRPSVHRQFGLKAGPGVTEIAAGRPVDKMRQRTPVETLDVIAAGSATLGHPTAIVALALERIRVRARGPNRDRRHPASVRGRDVDDRHPGGRGDSGRRRPENAAGRARQRPAGPEALQRQRAGCRLEPSTADGPAGKRVLLPQARPKPRQRLTEGAT